ncbi:MAG: C40 family peptidase [Elusimicrobia bacterium]|nr:C40 family peptidase [Elusimicrobiota bacterium]
MVRRLGRVFAAAVFAACSGAPRAPVPAAPAASVREQLVRSAQAYLPEEDAGRPAPSDPADFILRVYAEYGVAVPKSVPELSLAGVRVAPADLRPGDVLIFCGEKLSRIAEHAGLYAGKGAFLHFRPQYGVTQERLDAPYYRERLLTIRRVAQ